MPSLHWVISGWDWDAISDSGHRHYGRSISTSAIIGGRRCPTYCGVPGDSLIQKIYWSFIGGDMNTRFSAQAAPGAYKAMLGLEQYLHECGLEESLLHLIKLRTSQINGCAYCLDMHWKDLRAIGENEQRLYSLDAWRECPYYSERERAALAWTEAVTLITNGHVPDEVYEEVRPHFNEKELCDLTLAISTINGWNRLSISARTPPGTYQPVKTHDVKKSA
ncbi:MAG TPA: carboxymuconolactone decarboxylase family protein [Terriglobales bacterium]|nr:carboxymuconolactone decarboxylase family protein [Terriglobales bacterium]